MRRRGEGTFALLCAIQASPWISATAHATCLDHWVAPPPPKTYATELNGVQLPDVCIPKKSPPHNVFIIGDWGGTLDGPQGTPVTADHRAFGRQKRPFLNGIDDRAQHRVRDQMRRRAEHMNPDYILNVGDHFYWGGLEDHCGHTVPDMLRTKNWSFQWDVVYENMYTGKGLDGKQWLGVLGNHDYGGFMFTNAWDQAIARTWAKMPGFENRWILPAQYWKSKVFYPDFSVDYYFIDTNYFSTWEPYTKVGHNICGVAHNPVGASCGMQGPAHVQTCPGWFESLWQYQGGWLRSQLYDSVADWQIVVTHYPPCYGQPFWEELSDKFGVDLIITGHKHMQEIYHPNEPRNFLNATGWVVSGGGGGITSEGMPNKGGKDDQYGFMTMTLTKDTIWITNVAHGGFETLSGAFHRRECKECRLREKVRFSKPKRGFMLCGIGKCVGNGKHIINHKHSWLHTPIGRDGSAQTCLDLCRVDPFCIGYMVHEARANRQLHRHREPSYSTQCRILRNVSDHPNDLIAPIDGVDFQEDYFCWVKGPCNMKDIEGAANSAHEAAAKLELQAESARQREQKAQAVVSKELAELTDAADGAGNIMPSRPSRTHVVLGTLLALIAAVGTTVGLVQVAYRHSTESTEDGIGQPEEGQPTASYLRGPQDEVS